MKFILKKNFSISVIFLSLLSLFFCNSFAKADLNKSVYEFSEDIFYVYNQSIGDSQGFVYLFKDGILQNCSYDAEPRITRYATVNLRDKFPQLTAGNYTAKLTQGYNYFINGCVNLQSWQYVMSENFTINEAPTPIIEPTTILTNQITNTFKENIVGSIYIVLLSPLTYLLFLIGFIYVYAKRKLS